MNVKRFLAMLVMAVVCVVSANAQSWLSRLKDKAVDKVKQKVEQKVEDKAGEAADEVLNGKKKSKKSQSGDADSEDVEEGPQDTEAQYEQSDFVPGAVAFFEDDFVKEQMGEFPSKWDLIDGSADVANMKGKKCIHFEPGTRIEPLMTNQQSYIPDVFTLEFDFWMNDPKTE
nr:hypothetical protein [Prevotella sp.]